MATGKVRIAEYGKTSEIVADLARIDRVLQGYLNTIAHHESLGGEYGRASAEAEVESARLALARLGAAVGTVTTYRATLDSIAAKALRRDGGDY